MNQISKKREDSRYIEREESKRKTEISVYCNSSHSEHLHELGLEKAGEQKREKRARKRQRRRDDQREMKDERPGERGARERE